MPRRYTPKKYSKKTYSRAASKAIDRYLDNMQRRPRKGVRMGKIFRTKRGILGCYKYVNGKRVSFVRKYRR